jgi:hypothetical protein
MGCWWNDVLRSNPTAPFRGQPQTLPEPPWNLTRRLGGKEVVTDSTTCPQRLIVLDFKFDYV